MAEEPQKPENESATEPAQEAEGGPKKRSDEEKDDTPHSERDSSSSENAETGAASTAAEGGPQRSPEDEQEERELDEEGEERASSQDDEENDEDDEEAEGGEPRAVAASSSAPSSSGSKATIVALVALLAGGAIGYYGHDLREKQKIEKAGDACTKWQEKLCSEVGAESAPCTEAKAATNLLTPAACVAGLENIQATVAKAKQARAVCNDLVTRLCAEVGPETETCEMITDQTKAFPTSQCEMMDEQFDQVLARVRQIAAQKSRMGGKPPGMRRGKMPPGHPATSRSPQGRPTPGDTQPGSAPS